MTTESFNIHQQSKNVKFTTKNIDLKTIHRICHEEGFHDQSEFIPIQIDTRNGYLSIYWTRQRMMNQDTIFCTNI